MSQAVSHEQQEMQEGVNQHLWTPGGSSRGIDQSQLHSTRHRGQTSEYATGLGGFGRQESNVSVKGWEHQATPQDPALGPPTLLCLKLMGFLSPARVFAPAASSSRKVAAP